VVAAAVLLAVDARGLLTLNGLIKWKRLSFRLKVLVALLEIVLFQFFVLVYLAQRLLEESKRALGLAPLGDSGRVVEPAPEMDLGDGIAATQMDADAIQASLSGLLAEARNRLQQDLLERVRIVVAQIVDVLPAYRESHLEPQDRFVVERTARDYLPYAVRRYLKLPLAYRSVPLPEADNKTASQVLSDQLDLLIQRMRQVVDAAYRDDVDALVVHGRFLHSKFGASSLSIDS
jgi:hypothetical protein